MPAASAETAAASPTAVAAAHPVERRAGSDSASGLPPIAVVVDHLETEVVVDYLVVGLQAACTAVRLRRVQRRPVWKRLNRLSVATVQRKIEEVHRGRLFDDFNFGFGGLYETKLGKKMLQSPPIVFVSCALALHPRHRKN